LPLLPPSHAFEINLSLGVADAIAQIRHRV
jgi:hypothetical protein